MDIGSISSNALLGISRGINQANKSASDLASAEQLNGDRSPQETAKSLTELRQAETQVKVSAKVAQTEGDIIGSLLDVRA